VTHATEELGSLADTLVLLNRGEVVAAGPFEQIVTRSDLPFAARDDAGTVLTATVTEHERARHLTRLHAAGIDIWVSLLDREPGSDVRIRIPAREVILAPAEPGPTSVHNVLPGLVRAVTRDETKNVALVEIAMPNHVTFLSRVTLDSVEHLALKVDHPVVAMITSVSVEILPG